MTTNETAALVEFVRQGRAIGWGHPTGQYVDAACVLADELVAAKGRAEKAEAEVERLKSENFDLRTYADAKDAELRRAYQLTSPPAPSGWQQRIAAMSPWHIVGNCAECFFCGVAKSCLPTDGHYVQVAHKPDCLWQNAKDAPVDEGRLLLGPLPNQRLDEIAEQAADEIRDDAHRQRNFAYQTWDEYIHSEAKRIVKDAIRDALSARSPRPTKENMRTAREWIEEQYSYFIDPGKDAANRVQFVNAIMEVVEAACVDALKALPPAPEASPSPSEFDDLLGRLVVAARCDRRIDSTEKLMATLAALDGVREAIRQSWKCGGCGHGFATVGHMLHVSNERAAGTTEADASPAKDQLRVDHQRLSSEKEID